MIKTLPKSCFIESMLLKAFLLFASHFLIFPISDSLDQSYKGDLTSNFQVMKGGALRHPFPIKSGCHQHHMYKQTVAHSVTHAWTKPFGGSIMCYVDQCWSTVIGDSILPTETNELIEERTKINNRNYKNKPQLYGKLFEVMCRVLRNQRRNIYHG